MDWSDKLRSDRRDRMHQDRDSARNAGFDEIQWSGELKPTTFYDPPTPRDYRFGGYIAGGIVLMVGLVACWFGLT